MRFLKLLVVAGFAAALTASFAAPTHRAQSQTEAPAGFDNQTNGFTTQAEFDADRAAFEQREEIADGLGPVYNAQSCAECHQNPVTGGISQIFELRAGRGGGIPIPTPTPGEFGDGPIVISPSDVTPPFFPAPGGSLIQARAIDPLIQESVIDGPRIAFTGDQQLISVMAADGGLYGAIGNTPIAGSYPSFSPDGTRVVFQRDVGGSSNIFVMNTDGANLRQLTTTGQDITPVWGGLRITFASRRTGNWQIFTMNPDGTNQVNISNSSTDDTQPTYSTHLAFTRAQLPGPSLKKIWVHRVPDGIVQLTFGPGNDERPTFSPDGETIAFSTDRDGNREIYKIPTGGGSPTRLTNNPADDTNPAWAPDNSSIAFASSRNGGTRIWAMNPDGSAQAQISAGAGNYPAYSKQGDTIRTFRSSLNILGDGFVEAITDSTLIAIRDSQPSAMRGTAISVPVLESPGCDPQVPATCAQRLGRFGWKNSIASLLHFSAGAYLAESGITSPLLPEESTSLGRNVKPFDTVADPEDSGGTQGFGEDVEAFTRFMRSTKAPPRDRNLVPSDATDPGSQLFDQISCSVCHVRTITTAPAGTVINGGTFTVPPALGDKVIHPFSDFLLHNIGTGDGIVETNGLPTWGMVRTPPLWGLRTRERLMHDGGSSSPPSNNGRQSFTLTEAILRHAGQATASRTAFEALTPTQKRQLLRFLRSL